MKQLFIFSLALCLAAAAIAGEIETASPTPAPRFTISGWIDGGITFNLDTPRDNQNFGRLFDDRANEPLLNQAVINFERVLAAQPGEFDWGFKAQFMFGSDARYIHSLGLLDSVMKTSLYQPDIVEAYVSLHLSLLTERGVDVKLGKWVTLEGAETIDPRTNVFYSHTYIFNFGIPFNHTGALFTVHTTNWLDLMAGVTRGVNTSVEDNNDSPAFAGGVGLNLNEGKLVVSASTHIGPETPNNNSALRSLNDITVTWKIRDKLTSITDMNYARDDLANADGFGVAQYFTYAITDKVTAKIRGEIWRDDKGFFVAQFADPHDPVRALDGEATIDPRTIGGGRTTYGALTVGLDIKPAVPKPLTGLTIRPELRVDHSLNGTRSFNDSKDQTLFTAAVDAIITF